MVTEDDLQRKWYLIRTLSRTKRKDFENYVVNAIWNRVNEPDLMPVTQQYVRVPGNRYRLLDLYFPAVKIGVECDEGYHDSPEQQNRDAERERTIFDVLRSIDGREANILRIQVGSQHGLVSVERQINEVAGSIEDEVERLRSAGGVLEWGQMSPDVDDYFSLRSELSLDEVVRDNVSFRVISDAYRVLFGKKMSPGAGQSSFHKCLGKAVDPRYGDLDAVFLRTLGVEGSKGRRWKNQLSPDGLTIIETDSNGKPGDYVGQPANDRLVFASTASPLDTGKRYRFLGVFAQIPGPESFKRWNRVSTTVPLYRCEQ